MESKIIFKDPSHQTLFEKQGFVVLPNFLNVNEIKALEVFFGETHPQMAESGFFSGSYSSDFEYKKKVSDKIVAVFSGAYQKYFQNYQPFGGAFLYKVPGENSELAAHQDWTIVDEKKYVALNCWVPLCDVQRENGALMVLPGSHYDAKPSLRAPTLPFFFDSNDKVLLQELIPMEVCAGTAVVLNQSLIHYSPPNKSAAIRKAITAGVKSKNAQMYFHYKIPDEPKLEVFEMPDDFLISFKNFKTDIGERPYLGRGIGKIPYHPELYEGKDLYALLNNLKLQAGFIMQNDIAFYFPELSQTSISGNEHLENPTKKAWWKIW